VGGGVQKKISKGDWGVRRTQGEEVLERWSNQTRAEERVRGKVQLIVSDTLEGIQQHQRIKKPTPGGGEQQKTKKKKNVRYKERTKDLSLRGGGKTIEKKTAKSKGGGWEERGTLNSQKEGFGGEKGKNLLGKALEAQENDRFWSRK